MRNKLMVTAAVAALIGCTTFAVAQEPGKGEPAKGAAPSEHASPGGAMQHGQPSTGGAMQHGQPAPGGAMSHQPSAGGAAQNQSAPAHPSSVSQGEEHNNATNGQGAQNNASKAGEGGKAAQENAQGKERSRSDENARTQDRDRSHENAQNEDRTKDHNGRTEENAQTKAPENNHAATPGTSRENTAEGKGAAGSRNVKISEQQRTKIKDIIVREHNAPRVAHADFSVKVGVRVPRTVHFAALPADIIEIVPEYRGFDYVVVGDELLIIDPHTLEIVYILPA